MVARETCSTCGDVALEGLVVEVRGDTATVELGGNREEVGIELLEDAVAPGDRILCHAGVALRTVPR